MNEKQIIEKITKKQSLDIFRIGCERKNFSILTDIDVGNEITIEKIKKKYNLTAMPANRRVNLMENVGLVTRKGKSTVKITSLGRKFLQLISGIQKHLKKELTDNWEEFSLQKKK